MNVDIEALEKNLCQLMCAQISLRKKSESLLAIDTPFYFPDGDPYQIYIKEMSAGILRLTDMGHTLLHLSYDNDTSKFREGTRGGIFNQIKAEYFIEETNGEFYFDTTKENLGIGIFRIAQFLIRLNDLTFLNRVKVESTFYEDLQERLYRIVPREKVVKDYFYDQMENSQDYPIDYKIQGKTSPLFLFGVPNRDKARLTTIILERLLRIDAKFESIIVFSDQKVIPHPDLARLTNVGGEMIASLDAESDLSRKILKKIE
jgi:hypothetical protein